MKKMRLSQIVKKHLAGRHPQDTHGHPQWGKYAVGQNIPLDAFVGEHYLSGWNPSASFGGKDDDGMMGVNENMIMQLDGVNFAINGYSEEENRSYFQGISRTDETPNNNFPTQKVFGERVITNDPFDAKDVIVFKTIFGKSVLTIGDETSDPSYPNYIASFQPENMTINNPGSRFDDAPPLPSKRYLQ